MRPSRLTAQIILATLAVAAFVWLVNVLVNHPDVGTSALRHSTWIITLLTFLAVDLLVMLVMSDMFYDRVRGVHRVPTRDEDSLVIGCPACGTVFAKPVTQLDEDHPFGCANCGREGFVRDHSLNRKWIRNEHCKTCDTVYQEYKEFSECPTCHTFNQY